MSRRDDADALSHTRAHGVYAETPAGTLITTCARCSSYTMVARFLVVGGMWAGASYSSRAALCKHCAGQVADMLVGKITKPRRMRGPTRKRKR